MAITRQLELLIFDIGGVLAEISKAAVTELLVELCIHEQEFFDEDFSRLQIGAINPEHFFEHKSKRLGVRREQLTTHFARMINAAPANEVLSSITTPYFIFSNINQFHFATFCQTATLSPFALQHSLLSYQVGYLKPDAKFFARLLQTLPCPPSSTLYIDDKTDNLLAGQRIGLRTAHCPHPRALPDVIAKFHLI